MKFISHSAASFLIALTFSSCGPEEESTAPAKSEPTPEKSEKPVAEKPEEKQPTPKKPMKNAPDPGSDHAYVGLPLKEAETMAEESGLRHRVTMLDGQPRPATRDYRPDRLNFEVENGKVVKVSRG